MTAIEQWAPGTVHPTGDYDAVVFDGPTATYTRNGRRHRLDGPAESTAANENSGEMESWFVHGELHREDGPAETQWYGEHARDEVWLSHGKPHRLDGPAFEGFDALGRLSRTFFYVGGVGMSAEKHALVIEAIGSGAPLEWALAYASGSQT